MKTVTTFTTDSGITFPTEKECKDFEKLEKELDKALKLDAVTIPENLKRAALAYLQKKVQETLFPAPVRATAAQLIRENTKRKNEGK